MIWILQFIITYKQILAVETSLRKQIGHGFSTFRTVPKAYLEYGFFFKVWKNEKLYRNQ